MARIQSRGGFLKILLLIILIVVLIFGGLIWFDFLGLIDVKDTLSPVTKWLGIEPRTVLKNGDDIYLLDKERLRKQQESVDIRYEELNSFQEELEVKTSEIKQREDQLTEKENAVKEKEKSLNQALQIYENEEENLKQSARYLMGMEPEKAVAQLVNMDEYDAVDLLRMAERVSREEGSASLVAYWLSLMEPEKSASLQEKLIKSSGGEEFSEEQWFSN